MGRLEARNESADAGLFGNGVAIAFGLFSMVAQALLFRAYLTVFEGNEIGISAFFASWLTWVAVGAFAARYLLCRSGLLVKRFEFMPLLYIPAYLLQVWLIDNSRGIAGVESYELFPAVRLLPVSMLVNAPVSVLTGALFTLACRWMSGSGNPAVARVYVYESLGAVSGGLGATLLLAIGMSSETVFFVAAISVAAATAAYCAVNGSRIAGFLPLAALLATLFVGANEAWTIERNKRTWSRIMPESAYAGSFSTHQARYYYGIYGEQFNVVAWESVAETIPNREYSSEIVAIHLAQCPSAQRVAVIGSDSYSICRRLLDLQQIREVTWLHTDPLYPARLMDVLPEHLVEADPRLNAPGGDAGKAIQKLDEVDIIIINLPEIATLAINRYFTTDFFRLAGGILSENGVIGISVSGGENYMGDELVNLGSSVYMTMNTVFPRTAIKPGADTWLFGSGSASLTSKPEQVAQRFASIEGADDIYPPLGLIALFPSDRLEYQLASYLEAGEAGGELLINTDERPKALLYQALLALRQSGIAPGATNSVKVLALCGLPIALLAALVYSLFRCAFLASIRGRGPREGGTAMQTFDSYFIVFAAGAAAMSVNIALIFMYQAAHGSIFLHIGLVNALFMAGIFAGGMGVSSINAFQQARNALPALILLHIGLLLAVHLAPPNLSQPLFAFLFFTAGLLSGAYIPLVSVHLRRRGVDEGVAGGLSELNDHLGGAVGGLVTGLILIPVFGTFGALTVVGALIAANLPVFVFSLSAGNLVSSSRYRVKSLLFTGAGLTVFLVLAAGAYRKTQAATPEPDPPSPPAARTTSRTETAALPDGKLLSYAVIQTDPDSPAVYRFSTRSLAPGIEGFNGPVILEISMLENGTIVDVGIIEWQETPQYTKDIPTWLNSLEGRNAMDSSELKGIAGITGATTTSDAILETVTVAVRNFAEALLSNEESTLRIETDQASEPKRVPETKEDIPSGRLRGKPRDADIDLIKNMIEKRRLSDREALYYNTLP